MSASPLAGYAAWLPLLQDLLSDLECVHGLMFRETDIPVLSRERKKSGTHDQELKLTGTTGEATSVTLWAT